MLPDASLSAPVLVAGVLVLSGVSKILRPAGAAAAFETLGVPAALRRPAVVSAHPYAEIALALAVLLLPNPANVVAAGLTALLFATYLLLIWRAQARDEQAACNCFGSIGSAVIDGWTVARNAVFLVLAVLTVWDATQGSVIGRVLELGEQAWWLVGGAVAVASAALVLRENEPPATESGEDYWRMPIPDVAVRVGASTEETPLRELAKGRAQLLLFLSPGCGPCEQVTARLDEYSGRLPELDLRVVTPLTMDVVQVTAPAWVDYLLVDPDNAVSGVFGMGPRPCAVLLGGDGLLAGGPVLGFPALDDFVGDIEAELAPLRTVEQTQAT